MATNGNPEPSEAPQPRNTPAPGTMFGIPTKTLIIGGGAGGGILLVVIVVAVLFVSGVIGGSNPQPTSVLDLVPDDAFFVTRMDVRRILDNDLLADELFDDDFIDGLENEMGIDAEDLVEVVIAEWGSGEVIVMKGNFDLDFIRDEMEDEDAEENSYRGYEIWESADGSAGALLDEYIVISENGARPVENVLKNLYNGSGSLERANKDSEMKQILDKLGGGYMRTAFTGNACQVGRCEGYGFNVSEVDEADEESTVRIVLLFRNERAAEKAADDYDEVADFLEAGAGLDIEDTEADGKFVVGDAIRDLDDSRSSAPAPTPPEPAARGVTEVPMPTARMATAPTMVPMATRRAFAAAAPSRSSWLEDCADETLKTTNQYLARHEQLTREDAHEHCECLYDYIEEWEGPPPATMSDVIAGRLGADGFGFADVLLDASLYCG